MPLTTVMTIVATYSLPDGPGLDPDIDPTGPDVNTYPAPNWGPSYIMSASGYMSAVRLTYTSDITPAITAIENDNTHDILGYMISPNQYVQFPSDSPDSYNLLSDMYINDLGKFTATPRNVDVSSINNFSTDWINAKTIFPTVSTPDNGIIMSPEGNCPVEYQYPYISDSQVPGYTSIVNDTGIKFKRTPSFIGNLIYTYPDPKPTQPYLTEINFYQNLKLDIVGFRFDLKGEPFGDGLTLTIGSKTRTYNLANSSTITGDVNLRHNYTLINTSTGALDPHYTQYDNILFNTDYNIFASNNVCQGFYPGTNGSYYIASSRYNPCASNRGMCLIAEFDSSHNKVWELEILDADPVDDYSNKCLIVKNGLIYVSLCLYYPWISPRIEVYSLSTRQLLHTILPTHEDYYIGSFGVDSSSNIYLLEKVNEFSQDFYLVKYDSNYNIDWNVTYHNVENEYDAYFLDYIVVDDSGIYGAFSGSQSAYVKISLTDGSIVHRPNLSWSIQRSYIAVDDEYVYLTQRRRYSAYGEGHWNSVGVYKNSKFNKSTGELVIQSQDVLGNEWYFAKDGYIYDIAVKDGFMYVLYALSYYGPSRIAKFDTNQAQIVKIEAEIGSNYWSIVKEEGSYYPAHRLTVVGNNILVGGGTGNTLVENQTIRVGTVEILNESDETLFSVDDDTNLPSVQLTYPSTVFPVHLSNMQIKLKSTPYTYSSIRKDLTVHPGHGTISNVQAIWTESDDNPIIRISFDYSITQMLPLFHIVLVSGGLGDGSGGG
jgi:hypothetical protein